MLVYRFGLSPLPSLIELDSNHHASKSCPLHSQDTMRDAANPLLKRASFEEVRQAQAAQEDKEKAAKAAAEAKGLGSLFSTQKASWQMGDATS